VRDADAARVTTGMESHVPLLTPESRALLVVKPRGELRHKHTLGPGEVGDAAEVAAGAAVAVNGAAGAVGARARGAVPAQRVRVRARRGGRGRRVSHTWVYSLRGVRARRGR